VSACRPVFFGPCAPLKQGSHRMQSSASMLLDFLNNTRSINIITKYCYMNRNRIVAAAKMTAALPSEDDSSIQAAPTTSLTALQETLGKIQSSVVPAVETLLALSSSSSSSHKPSSASASASSFATIGLDFLHVKNSVLLSYLIELIVHVRDQDYDQHHSNDEEDQQQQQQQQQLPSNHRLLEIMTVLDKSRGLDKKLRYQIDKLLAISTTAASFASGTISDYDDIGDDEVKERYHQKTSVLVESATNHALDDDPLQFRPDPKSFFESATSNDDDDDVDDNRGQIHVKDSTDNAKKGNTNNDNDDDDSNEGIDDDADDDDDDDDDDDLAAARQTLALSSQTTKTYNRTKSSKRSISMEGEDDVVVDDDDDDNSNDKNDHNGADGSQHMSTSREEQENAAAAAAAAEVYRAPRLTAVPYRKDERDGEWEQQQQRRRRRFLRTSELAQTLRDQYGETPDQEDIHGGGNSDLYGKQRAATTKLRQQEVERTEYEESAMIRLMTSRKEKKETKRIRRMVEGGSNLAQIANLRNLVRETEEFGSSNNNSRNSSRHGSGRKVQRHKKEEDEEEEERAKALEAFYQSHGNSKKKAGSTNSHRHPNGKRKRRPTRSI
jgi:hypothetical protein